MVYVGLNGFGRIGKSIFIQLLSNKTLKIKAINITKFDLNNLASYLENDSTHHYNTNWDLKIIDETKFSINGEIIYMFNERDASHLNWKKYDNIEYVIDCTGAYLTQDDCKKHNIDYVIMCAPPKDNSPQYVVSVNEEKYNGEKIVSNASCTTNCISPVLGFLEKNYKIQKANFTTIHATTASQNPIDTNHFNNRTSRSILNNIIPHNTGASKSIKALLPSLDGKVKGTSLRIPVNNVSIVDLNVTLETNVSKEELMCEMEKSGYISINNRKLVSSDFNTTTTPSIIDKDASIQLTENEFKLMIWYDNEWSYSAQVIRLAEHMVTYNNEKNNHIHPHFITNYNFENKDVILRVDWNIPYNKDNYTINDDFRIVSSLKTIKYILDQHPNRVVIISHLGRPCGNGYEEEFTWKHFMKQLQSYFDETICLLEDGISNDTITKLEESEHRLYLLENIRFHKEETKYDGSNNEIVTLYNKLGNIYVNDAFGCMHRGHMSILGFKGEEKAFGFLVEKEKKCLDLINKNLNHEKILSIIGGGKMDDKIALLGQLSKKVDGIYISGGNINSIVKNKEYKQYIEDIKQNNSSIYQMKDGLASIDLTVPCTYYNIENLPENKYFFDIGMQSIIELNNIIQNYDIIFWNGTLGVVENDLYSYGSLTLLELLKKSGKKVIVGGGDTVCFVNKHIHDFYYVSTGGGASIDYISNGDLVGIKYFG
tara:strand:+ start:1513 stop:3645 length:2133 start_codon:yes stop_codon:yes gene_type:complete